MKTKIIFLCILFLGVALRFYRLGSVPIGFHVDEAYFGYNAYSLLQTGRDMTGNFLPFHFASFLYSPAGYSYLTIPWIMLFGLTPFAVRFTSAFFGSLTIILVFATSYFLPIEKKYKVIVGLSSMLLLAISPWHIILSRTATENVVVVFFLGLGFLLSLFWVRKNNVWFGLGSFFCFGMTLLLYQAPRAFLPIFLPILFLVLLYKQKKKLLTAAILYIVIILLPVFLILSSPKLSQRITMLSVLKYPGVQLMLDEQIREDGVMHTPLLFSRLFHNKLSAYTSQILHNYFLHFSYDFLFGDSYLPVRYHVVDVGLLYIFELPLIFLGLYFLLRKQPQLFIILACWMLIAPLGSALTFDDIPNMQRTLLIFPITSLVEGFGFLQLFLLTKRMKKTFQYGAFFVAGIVVLYSLGFFLHQYFVNNIVYQPWHRQEGTQEMVEKVAAIKNNYSEVVVGNADPNLSVFFLFFGRYNPRLFQENIKKYPQLVNGGHYGSIPFASFSFDADGCPVQEKLLKPTDTLPTVTGKAGILYVDAGICTIPKTHVKIIATIKKPDQTPAYYLLEYLSN